MVGSLIGAVSSQKVTEEYEGHLGTVGHRTDSAMAKGGLTARPTSRAGAKAMLHSVFASKVGPSPVSLIIFRMPRKVFELHLRSR